MKIQSFNVTLNLKKKMLRTVTFVVPLIAMWSSSLIGKTIEISPDSDFKAKIKSIESGDKVVIYPGVYHESIYTDKSKIHFQGVIKNGEWPILDGKGELNDGIISSGSGSVFENLYIRRYKGNGVTTQGANHIIMRRLIVEDTGLCGIYPTRGKNITIEDTVSFGIADAGIYVGMCDNVDVRRNEVYENVGGIEIENSTNVIVEHNYAYNNSAGILIFALPGLPKKESFRTIVRDNFVYDNNHRNFGHAGSAVASVPPGSGIILLAPDKVNVYNNTIRGNAFAGLIIADLSILPSGQPDPQLDPLPDEINVFDNIYIGNGEGSLAYYMVWSHYVIRSIFAGSAGNGGIEDLIPYHEDILVAKTGKEVCLYELGEVRSQKIGDGQACSKTVKPSRDTDTTMVEAFDAEAIDETKVANQGKWVYEAVCAGCHSYAMRVIGPAFKEVIEKYEDKLDGFIAFVKNPEKVRPSYPVMPSHAYLGDEKIKSVGEYVLDPNGLAQDSKAKKGNSKF